MAERDLTRLLAGLEPVLDPARYAFVCVPAETPDPPDLLMRMREAEGDTLILPASEAVRQGWTADPAFRRIVLSVHSDLEAVGLTAAVSARLTQVGIPANVVAGFHHDHLFVPESLSEPAMAALLALSRDTRAEDAGSRHP
jgi:hypothetical protein